VAFLRWFCIPSDLNKSVKKSNLSKSVVEKHLELKHVLIKKIKHHTIHSFSAYFSSYSPTTEQYVFLCLYRWKVLGAKKINSSLETDGPFYKQNGKRNTYFKRTSKQFYHSHVWIEEMLDEGKCEELTKTIDL